MIKLNQVSKTYKLGKTEVKALKNVNLEINKGDFVAVVGPSGSGKTTLLNLIGCLDKPDEGEILLEGENVLNKNFNQLADLRLKKIGFIFQSFNLIPVLNVYENIEFPALLLPRKEREKNLKEKIFKLIEEVGLSEHISHKPDELSGGQRQRVAIARALVNNPVIVLADEPTANLDSENAEKIIDLMRRLNDELNTTFVFATHDTRILKHVKRIVELKDGKIVK